MSRERTKTMRTMRFLSLQDRLQQMSDEDKDTLREIRHRMGEFPYSEKSADKLTKAGLATWIGGEAFITETGRRALELIGKRA